MIPPWWGIPAVLIVGIAVVCFGWWRDHRRHQDRIAALQEPPARAIPAWTASGAPTYTTEPDLDGRAVPAATTPALAGSGATVEVPGGIADTVFLNAPDQQTGTLSDPHVLITDAALVDDRLLLDVLARTASTESGLVLVAPEYAARVLGTLRANAVTGRISILPIVQPKPTLLHQAVALTGGVLVTDSDLRSGYLPGPVWGTCAAWHCDLTTSWVQLHEEPANPEDSQPDLQGS
ncbi:MAG: hypothetical protein ACK5LN_12405 [Propioniciclava sp.]